MTTFTNEPEIGVPGIVVSPPVVVVDLWWSSEALNYSFFLELLKEKLQTATWTMPDSCYIIEKSPVMAVVFMSEGSPMGYVMETSQYERWKNYLQFDETHYQIVREILS